MRDFLPAQKARRERILGIIRSSYRGQGFEEIETPVMEDIDRLHSGLGGDNEKLSFSVLRRGLTAEDLQRAADEDDALALADLGLRFDLTVPLARFYTTHRGELPSVFRSIQIAPVWRAERPQRGRFRQFVQCDIDILGEPSALAEAELIEATLATLSALGLAGCSIRVNDRRILAAMLDAFGFGTSAHPSVLITVDKLDKIGISGVIDELRTGDAPADAVAALEAFLTARGSAASADFSAAGIAAALPAGVDPALCAQLAALGECVDRSTLVFDPFLVRGMGYYTGTIFEIEHPEFPSSLGGGGRYDGMIGRFLGEDVPACGFSIGFERIVDLVEIPDEESASSIVLLYSRLASAERPEGVRVGALMDLKRELVAQGVRVGLERRPKNVSGALDRAAKAGFRRFAFVEADTARVDQLTIKDL